MSEQLDNIVKNLKSNFVYTRDHKFFDAWQVMSKQKDGKYYGDCEDFALTVIWKLCNENLFLFTINFLILHRYHIWLAKTDEVHAVGYAQGKYFDNIYGRTMTRKQLKESTDIKLWVPMLSPLIASKLIFGLIKKVATKS